MTDLERRIAEAARAHREATAAWHEARLAEALVVFEHKERVRDAAAALVRGSRVESPDRPQLEALLAQHNADLAVAAVAFTAAERDHDAFVRCRAIADDDRQQATARGANDGR